MHGFAHATGALCAGGHSELATSAFTDLQQLWTELKDRLALKVFASLRQSAGLPPPLGLLSLPTELKTKILSSLQVCSFAIATAELPSFRFQADGKLTLCNAGPRPGCYGVLLHRAETPSQHRSVLAAAVSHGVWLCDQL